MPFPREFSGRALAVIATALGLSSWLAPAHATVIYDSTVVLKSTDPTQLGRLSRSGVPSDWSALKTFPGVINTATSYHYQTLTLDVPALEAGYTYGSYLQITFNSLSTNTFLSAYLGSFVPTNLATNYFGDEGSSTFFPDDVSFFQLVQPSNQKLVLVVNETTANAGIGVAGEIIVEAFSDTEYSDLNVATVTAVPEPGTYALLGAGLTLVGLAGQRRRAAAGRASV